MFPAALRMTRNTVMKLLKISSRVIRNFPFDQRYLIGVSGGRDSIALLHWLINLGYKKLVVCHLNHQLRGRSSDVDARFVQKVVEHYNQEFVAQTPRAPRKRTGKRGACPKPHRRDFHFQVVAANVRALARRQKMSIETAAREARYKFFADTARRRKCRTIFLAHHADDVVETFLINLFRGAGFTGLAGMREISIRRMDDIDLAIVRPLLGAWRKDIDAYVSKHRLTFREDASNQDLNPVRNRIRHRVIPYLEKILGRNIRPAIWRAATIAGEEEAWIEKQFPHSSDAQYSAAQLRELPVAVQRRVILRWLRAQRISEISFDVIERVRSLVDHDADTAKVNLPKDRHARRRSGKIFIE